MSRMTRNAAVALSLCCLAVGVHAADRSKTRIADEGSIGDQWTLAEGTKLAIPGYPAERKEQGDSVCIGLGYSISPDGKTGDFTTLRQWSSAGDDVPKDYYAPYAAAAAGALSQWQFKPRAEVEKPQRTITVATLTFRGKDAMDGKQLAANCRIADLAKELREAGSKADRDLVRREMERDARAANANQSMVNNPGQQPTRTGR